MTQTFQAHDFCLLVDESTHANMLGDIWELVNITLLENNGDQIFFNFIFKLSSSAGNHIPKTAKNEYLTV